jgi:hypothetical protein
MVRTSGSCDTAKPARSGDSIAQPGAPLQPHTASHSFVVRESCYSVLQTLLHGAFLWLQPRSPVVAEVVERGRGPDPPVARAALASGPPGNVPALASRAEERLHRGVAAEENPPPVARAGVGNRQRGNQPDAKEERARAEAAEPVLAAEHSLPWLASNALRRVWCTRPRTSASARSIRLPSSSRIGFSFHGVRQPLSVQQRLSSHGCCA